MTSDWWISSLFMSWELLFEKKIHKRFPKRYPPPLINSYRNVMFDSSDVFSSILCMFLSDLWLVAHIQMFLFFLSTALKCASIVELYARCCRGATYGSAGSKGAVELAVRALAETQKENRSPEKWPLKFIQSKYALCCTHQQNLFQNQPL